jgi:hypothetical protein
MLCGNCQLHFDFSSQDYSSVKDATISSLRKLGADPSLLEYLETDLKKYQHARGLSQSDSRADICPWIPESFSLNVPENVREKLQDHEFSIWEMRRLKKNSNDSLDEECEMCLRILEAIKCLGFDPNALTLGSSLVLEPLTLLPLRSKS